MWQRLRLGFGRRDCECVVRPAGIWAVGRGWGPHPGGGGLFAWVLRGFCVKSGREVVVLPKKGEKRRLGAVSVRVLPERGREGKIGSS